MTKPSELFECQEKQPLTQLCFLCCWETLPDQRRRNVLYRLHGFCSAAGDELTVAEQTDRARLMTTQWRSEKTVKRLLLVGTQTRASVPISDSRTRDVRGLGFDSAWWYRWCAGGLRVPPGHRADDPVKPHITVLTAAFVDQYTFSVGHMFMYQLEKAHV